MSETRCIRCCGELDTAGKCHACATRDVLRRTPEHVYIPSCARCRDKAGKDRAGVPDDALCAWHTTDELARLRAALAAAESEAKEAAFAAAVARDNEQQLLAAVEAWKSRALAAEAETASVCLRLDAVARSLGAASLRFAAAERERDEARATVKRYEDAFPAGQPIYDALRKDRDDWQRKAERLETLMAHIGTGAGMAVRLAMNGEPKQGREEK